MTTVIEPNNGHAESWDTINWEYHEEHVRHIQERIFRETQMKEWKKVLNLQKLLFSSYSAHLVAVKRVTQENSGHLTAGIDKKLYLSAESRIKLVDELHSVKIDTYLCLS